MVRSDPAILLDLTEANRRSTRLNASSSHWSARASQSALRSALLLVAAKTRQASVFLRNSAGRISAVSSGMAGTIQQLPDYGVQGDAGKVRRPSLDRRFFLRGVQTEAALTVAPS
jgi:hypothetical protein